MEIFILLLVLALLSGMVFTFVKACQVIFLEHKVRKLENELAEIKAHMDMHMSYGKSVTGSTPQNAARPGAATPRPVPSPPRAATAIPRSRTQEGQTAGSRFPRLFLGIFHRSQAAFLDRRIHPVSGNGFLCQIQH